MAIVTTTGPRTITSNVALATSMVAKTVTGGVKLFSASPSAGGTGYTAGDVLTLSGYGSKTAQATVAEVAAGVVTVVSTTPANPGDGYVVGSDYAVTGGTGGDDCTVEVTEIFPDKRPITVHEISCSLIADTGGVQCGQVSLRDGLVVLWSGFVHGTVNAANQGVHNTFKLDFSFTPVTDVNVLYTAVTNATTASVALVWSG